MSSPQGKPFRGELGMAINRDVDKAIPMPRGVDIWRQVKYHESNKLHNLTPPSHDLISAPGVRITEEQGKFTLRLNMNGL
jgi:hypothetical protein